MAKFQPSKWHLQYSQLKKLQNYFLNVKKPRSVKKREIAHLMNVNLEFVKAWMKHNFQKKERHDEVVTDLQREEKNQSVHTNESETETTGKQPAG